MYSKILVLHHDDMDGRAAAAVVAQKHNASFVEMNYSRAVPWDRFDPETAMCVFIVDFSLKPDDMARLVKLAGDTVWLDHHRTALEALREFEYVKGIRTTDVSGALLTWEYCFPDTPAPTAIKLVSDYDCWKHTTSDSMDFMYGIKAYDTAPESKIWSTLLSTGSLHEEAAAAKLLGEIIQNGGAIRKAFNSAAVDAIMSNGFYATIDGHACAVVNHGRGPDTFAKASIQVQKAEILSCYWHDGDKFTVSLYSETVDVSEIAKRHGGGGHKGAAGFTCETLPFCNKKPIGGS